MDSSPLKVIQITDIHLFKDKDSDLLGVKTYDSFTAVLELIKNESDMDFILLTGDLSQDASVESYKQVAELLQAFKVPIYFVPGNHDEAVALQQVYPYLNIVADKQIVQSTWQFILLNSQIPCKVPGYFEETELAFLEKCLADKPDLNAAVIFHHQPFPVGAAWLDKLGVQNADEFWRVVLKYPTIKSIIFGHVHQEGEKIHLGIPCFWTPSTCIQFKAHQDEFGLAKLPPGYRVFEFYPDGRVESTVKRVEKYIGEFDADAKGY